ERQRIHARSRLPWHCRRPVRKTVRLALREYHQLETTRSSVAQSSRLLHAETEARSSTGSVHRAHIAIDGNVDVYLAARGIGPSNVPGFSCAGRASAMAVSAANPSWAAPGRHGTRHGGSSRSSR